MAGKLERDYNKERRGWLYITAIMVVFPIVFFLCVWFPIWMNDIRFP